MGSGTGTQRNRNMKWIGKDPPIYIYLGDEWERENDHKLFKTHEDKKCWLAADGEKVEWKKNAKVKKRL